MSAGDTARATYESARQELIQRITLRDHVLLVYLGAVGTILAIALGTDARNDILMLIPFISLGAAVLVSQHNSVIGSLGDFCVNELDDFFISLKPSEWAPQWDKSKALQKYSSKSIRLRSWGHSIIVIIPSVLGLAINWNHALYSPFPEGIVWWFAALCFALAIWIITVAHNLRVQLYRKYKWVETPNEAM